MTDVVVLGRTRSHLIGVGMLLFAGFCLSIGGIMVRNMQPDTTSWQVLFYRAAAIIAATLAIMAWQYRGRLREPFRAMGIGGFLASICFAVSMTTYIFALKMTTVANAMFIISASPFFTAILAWFLLRERVRWLTWLAIGIAMVGIALMFNDEFSGGRPDGVVVALICSVTFATTLVALRRKRNVDMLPMFTTASVIITIAAAIIADDLRAPLHDILLAFLMGVGQTGVGFFFMMLGSRRVPAAEVSLLLLSEPILAPIWVWLFIGEVPSSMALFGGLIVFGAVAAQAIAGVMWERRGLPA
ncbi:MAG: DMT family transporter [Dongiaceae bacterium]